MEPVHRSAAARQSRVGATPPRRRPIGPLERNVFTWTLFSLAVAQPCFDVLGRNAELLVAHELEPGELLLLAAVTTLAAPLAVLLLDRLASLVSAGLARGLHLLAWTFLGATIVLQALRGAGGLPGTVLVAVALAAGAVFVWSVARFAPARLFLWALSPAVILVPALFLFRPPISGLVFPETVRPAGGAAIDSTTPVVLVVFDELPLSTLLDGSGRINAYRYPHFARLAGRSTWYRNATTVAEGTAYAVPAILTGRYPDRRRLAVASAYPENLFTWLGSSYRLDVHEFHTGLCPDELCRDAGPEGEPSTRLWGALKDLGAIYPHLILPADLTGRLPVVTGNWKGFWASERVSPVSAPGSPPVSARGGVARVVTRFVAAIRPTRRGVCHYLHLALPHIPWKYLPSGREYGPLGAALWPHGAESRSWEDDEWATIQGYQRHILQTGYADAVLGEIVAALEAAGLYRRSLVIVTADHGVSFWPGSRRRGVSENTPADVMAVPLFVKLPDQERGEVSDRNVETVDILPTVADVLGVEPPWPVDGVSVLAPSTRVGKTLVTWNDDEPVPRRFGDRVEGEATLRRKLALFGSGEDPDSLFRIGRFGALVGRPAAERAAGVGSSLAVELDDARLLRDVDPRGAFVPAHLSGRIDFGAGAGAVVDLAVAVNGIVRAVTRTFRSPRGRWELTAMVAETSFRAGANRVDVYQITGSETSPRLALLAQRGAVDYRLTREPDGTERLVASDGRVIEVRPGRLQGAVHRGDTHFRGWAVDLEGSRPAEQVLFFAGRDFVTAAAVGDWRRDVARKLGNADFRHSGFTLVIPHALIQDRDDGELVFYGVAGDVASPLRYRPGETRP